MSRLLLSLKNYSARVFFLGRFARLPVAIPVETVLVSTLRQMRVRFSAAAEVGAVQIVNPIAHRCSARFNLRLRAPA